uniref:Uncharacterized protein n=1 Tax=Manihot esculenta TaxID=3983 RepID=A0A2C9VHK2_MANES
MIINAFTEFENLRLEGELCQFSARTVPMGLLLLHQSQARAVESPLRAKMQHKEFIILCLEDCSDWSIATNGRAVMQGPRAKPMSGRPCPTRGM